MHFTPILLLVSLLLPLAAGAAEASFIGRSVAEILEAARVDGIVIVFNTQLVPPDLTVVVEPRARSGLALVSEVLAAQELELIPVAPGAYAVRRVQALRTPPQPAIVRPAPPLEEVIVTTSRYVFGEDAVGSHTLVSGEVLQTLPRLGEDALKAVQRLPGVAGNGLSGLSPVRGGEPGETLILLDGLALHEPFHLKNFLGPISVLDSRFIGGLDFHSGGFGAEYGDRMSAVIDARSQPSLPRHYELGVSLFHLNGLASGTVGDSDWLVSARQSNLGRVLDALDTDFGNPEYSDGFARFRYALSASTRLTFNLLAARDEVNVIWERSGEDSTANSRNFYLWSAIEHESGALSSRLQASYTDVNNQRRGSLDDPLTGFGTVSDQRDFSIAGLDAAFSWRGLGGLHRWGGEVKRVEADYAYASRMRFTPTALFPDLPTGPVSRETRVLPAGWKYAGYWSSRFELTDALATELGVRLEDQAYTGPEHSVQVEPRLSAMYAFDDATRVRLSWGWYSQSQRINELQIEDGINVFLPAQHAMHLVASLERAWTPHLQTRVELYRKEYSRLRPRYENLFTQLVLLPELHPDRVAVLPGGALAYGAEVSLSWRPDGPWSSWLSYAWSEVEDVIDDSHVVRSWDQKHAVSAGMRWTKGRWDITLADTFHTGWPMTPVTLSALNEVVVGSRNGGRLNSFHSLDLRASRKFGLARGDLEAYLEITNLANESNDCCVDYRVTTQPDGSAVLDRRVDHWLGIVPSVGVLWRY